MKQTRTRERSQHETRQSGTRSNGNRSNRSKTDGSWSKEPRSGDSNSRGTRSENPWSKESRPKRKRTDGSWPRDSKSIGSRSNDIKPNWKPEGSWAQDAGSNGSNSNNSKSEGTWSQDSRTSEPRQRRNRSEASWSQDSRSSDSRQRSNRSNDSRSNESRSGNSRSNDSRSEGSWSNDSRSNGSRPGKTRTSGNSWAKDSRPNRSRNNGGGNRTNRGKSKFGRKNKNFDISKYESHGNEEHVVEKYVNQHSFSDFKLQPELLERINQKGYTNPTEIQDKAIPQSMGGRDLIGIAGTGTGKTATFLIPIIQELIINPTHNKALIITPTRELATQIFEEFRDLTRGLNLYSTCLIGGNPVHKSIKDLSRPNHIIIGTPGRLVDMANRRHLNFGKFETLVLDEFDRMLDMGFVDEVKDINASMTNKKQTFLFSATMDKSIKSIVEHITNDPIVVMATAGVRPSNSIKQEVLHVPSDKKKIDFLTDIISEWEAQKILVFCTTKRKVDQVHKSLHHSRITTDLIHGDKSQRAREVALRKFKSGKIDVLVATDVVARGIDVSDVSLVINYEIPHDYTDYIHRIGRTGRAGKLGKAITLID